MARFEEGNFKGAIGGIIFYSMNGKNYIRARPVIRKKKKTALQTLNVSIFTKASKYGTPVLNLLQHETGLRFSQATYNTFRGWLINQLKLHDNDSEWKLSITDSPICNLNPSADLRDYLMVMPELVKKDHSVSIIFPSFIPLDKIKAPAKAVSVNIKMIVIAAPFSENKRNILNKDNYEVLLNKTAVDKKEFVIDTGSFNSILFVAIALEYVYGGRSENYVSNQPIPVAITAIGKK
jgi:hypothetical protein